MKTIKNISITALVLVFLGGTLSCKKESTDPETATADTSFTLSSAAVENGQLLSAYKCESKVNGTEKSIPLSWSNAPSSANSFAITMVHYPFPGDSIHLNSYLILWGIGKSVTGIPYGMGDQGPWFMGPNKDTVAISYTSPCSPSSGSHRYTITIYALSATPPELPAESSMSVTYGVLMNAISTVTVVGKARLVFDNVTP